MFDVCAPNGSSGGVWTTVTGAAIRCTVPGPDSEGRAHAAQRRGMSWICVTTVLLKQKYLQIEGRTAQREEGAAPCGPVLGEQRPPWRCTCGMRGMQLKMGPGQLEDVAPLCPHHQRFR